MAGNPDLFGSDDVPEGDDERAPSGFFARVEEAGERRGVGRPKGARNRKSEAFERWYYAKGFKDPAQVLGELASMDPIALHGLMVEHAIAQGVKRAALPVLGDAIAIIRGAASELMPYLHGKKPISVDLGGVLLPMLGINAGSDQMGDAAKVIEGREVMRLGAQPEGSENKDLAEGEK